jgi:hypothetical protein
LRSLTYFDSIISRRFLTSDAGGRGAQQEALAILLKLDFLQPVLGKIQGFLSSGPLSVTIGSESRAKVNRLRPNSLRVGTGKLFLT